MIFKKKLSNNRKCFFFFFFSTATNKNRLLVDDIYTWHVLYIHSRQQIKENKKESDKIKTRSQAVLL